MHSSTLVSEIFELAKNDKVNELTQLLIQNKNSLSVLNEVNAKKETPLHISASNLSFECTQLLLESGAQPNFQDAVGRTPVFCILSKLKDCNCDTCSRRAMKCINLLGEFNADMNLPDIHGEIPLHLAAQLQAEDCVSSLLDNGAVVGTYNGIPMLAILLERIPSIIVSVLDRSVEFGTKCIHEPDCEVVFDLGVILPSQVMAMRDKNNTVKSIQTDNSNSPGGNSTQTSSSTTANENYQPQQEMEFLSNLSYSTDEDSKTYKAILHHPLVNVFSDIKWKRLELLFYAFLLLQISVLIAYTLFIFLTIFKDCPYDFVFQALKLKEAYLRTKDAGGKLPMGNLEKVCEINIVTKAVSIYVVFCTIIVIIKELQHAIMDCREYFKDVLNYSQLVGLAAIAATTVIAWDFDSKIYSWLSPVAAFGMGISWFQIFIQIGRMPQLAIYVDMFAKIAINFCWSLCIYSLILIGFAMSYCVLFPEKPHLVDIPLAMIKVLTMMVGELDYEGLFPESAETWNNSTNGTTGPFGHPVTAHLWYVAFVIMVTLVLMNLLVGLAVSDIHGCKKNAEIFVIKRRIRYIAYLENTFFLATNFCPKIVKDFLRKRISIVIPQGERFHFWRRASQVSDLSSIKVRPNDSADNVLSNESKKSIKYWIMAKGKNERRKCNYKKETTVVEDTNKQKGSWTSEEQPEGISSLKIELSIQRLERRLTDLDTKLDKLFYKMSEQLLLSE